MSRRGFGSRSRDFCWIPRIWSSHRPSVDHGADPALLGIGMKVQHPQPGEVSASKTSFRAYFWCGKKKDKKGKSSFFRAPGFPLLKREYFRVFLGFYAGEVGRAEEKGEKEKGFAFCWRFRPGIFWEGDFPGGGFSGKWIFWERDFVLSDFSPPSLPPGFPLLSVPFS